MDVEALARQVGVERRVATVAGIDVPHYTFGEMKLISLVEKVRAAVLEEAARKAEAQTYRSRWAHGKANALPTPECEIAATIRAMKP